MDHTNERKKALPSSSNKASCGAFASLTNFIKNRDDYGEGFHMKLDDGDDVKTSFLGGICSLILLIVVIMYAYLKGDVLINKKDVDILSTVNDMFIEPTERFTNEQGFAFAVAFTGYDSVQEPILTPDIGTLVFNHYSWGPTEDGFASERKEISSHTCTDEELGLAGDEEDASFLPIYPKSKDEMIFYK